MDLLNLNLKGEIQVQIKRDQRFIGTLAGFDEHLNIYVENTVNEYFIDKPKEEASVDDAAAAENSSSSDEVIKHQEAVGNIILRGDNIIFMKFTRPVFNRPPKRDYQRRRSYPDRRPRGSSNYNRQRSSSGGRQQGSRPPYKRSNSDKDRSSRS
ncbi:MAG: LSM domain-containing protein [Promethearchaeota archaeon]